MMLIAHNNNSAARIVTYKQQGTWSLLHIAIYMAVSKFRQFSPTVEYDVYVFYGMIISTRREAENWHPPETLLAIDNGTFPNQHASTVVAL
jgi:hypothetical protein